MVTPQETIASNAKVGGRYELLAPLEDQGLGDTWKARDTRVAGRQVAVKFLRMLPGGATVMPDELAATLKRLKALRHGNVLAVLHHGVWARRPYLVQDLFEGPSLAAGLARAAASPLPLALLERLFGAILDAVEAAHAASPPIAHGALHPRSVLIQRASTQEFELRVTDFAVGPYASAQERAEGAAADDARGLGEILMAMLGDASAPTRPRADTSTELRAVARAAISARAEERFRDVAALRDALRGTWALPPADAEAAEAEGPPRLWEGPAASAPVVVPPEEEATVIRLPNLSGAPPRAEPTTPVLTLAPAPPSVGTVDFDATVRTSAPLRAARPAHASPIVAPDLENTVRTARPRAAPVVPANKPASRDGAWGSADPDDTLFQIPGSRSQPVLDATLVAAPFELPIARPVAPPPAPVVLPPARRGRLIVIAACGLALLLLALAAWGLRLRFGS